MAEDKKSKTIKNVTEIPNASVKIEVEEKEEPAEKTPPDQTADNTSEGENSKQTDEINDPETSDGFGWKKLILTVLIVVPIGFFLSSSLSRWVPPSLTKCTKNISIFSFF